MNSKVVQIVVLGVTGSIQLLMAFWWAAGSYSPIGRMIGEVSSYLIFCAFIIGAGIYLAWRGLPKNKDHVFWDELNGFCIAEVILTFLLLSAMYKTIIYDYRGQLAQQAYSWLLILAVLNKILWPKFRDLGRSFYSLITRKENHAALVKISDVIFAALIVVIIYIPDIEAVVARIFIGEQFHHNDSFVMGPAWAYLSGNVLDVDTFSQYGLGMPVVLGLLAKALGGFSYEHVMSILVYGTIAYFLACYVFLRVWLKSPALAMAGILLAIKWQMFHTGVYPFVFTYGSATIWRYPFDIFFLLMILFHLRTERKVFLVGAGLLCGAATFYISSEGIYLTATYCAYLLIRCFLVHGRSIAQIRKSWTSYAGLLMIAPVTALSLLFLTTRQHIFQRSFWLNAGEFINYFLSGYGTTPMYASLLNHHYLASWVGFFIPLVYVLTMIIVGTLCFLGKIRNEHWLTVILCVYGLGEYHYYIARSEVTSYYAVCLPYVFILCYWAHLLIKRLPTQIVVNVLLGILLACGFSLATNHTYIAYPNRLNISSNPMVDPLVAQPLPNDRRPYFNHMYTPVEERIKLPVNSLGQRDEDIWIENSFISDEALKAYYRLESDFSQDARLIQSLTPKGSRVPLISSFEIKILMQADRRPYFYYFPLVISRPMKARSLVMVSLFTEKQVNKVLSQLEKDKPDYIFMARIFLSENITAITLEESPGLIALLQYVREKYAADAQGQYLVAMKRKT